MKTDLIAKFQFLASHSLAGYEIPHAHLWRLEITLSGEPKNGKIIDLIAFRENVQELIAPLESQYLNNCSAVTTQVREFPTCETLSVFFHEKIRHLTVHSFSLENPSIYLQSTLIAICAIDGTETGAVRISC